MFVCQGLNGILTSILVARYLGPALMGEYSFIIWLIGIVVILVGMGFPSTITKFISELIGSKDTQTAQEIYSNLAQIQLIVSILVTLVCIGIIYLKFCPPQRDYYVITFLSLCPLCMSAFFSSAFYGLQNFKVTSIIGSVINIIQLMLTIIFIALDLGLKALLAISLISSLFYALLLAYYLYPTWNVISPLKIQKEFKNRIISYSLSVYWTIVLSLIVWQKSEMLFLKIYAPSEEIAFYNIAFNIAFMMIGLTSLFSTVIFPIFSNFHGAGDRVGIQNIFTKSIKVLFICYLPVCIILIVVAKPIVSLMYSSQFLAVSPLLIILMAGSIFSAIGILFANLIFAVNRPDIQVKYVTVIAITNIVLDLLLIPRYGAVGAALANSAIRIISFPIWIWLIKEKLGFHYPMRETLRCIVPNIPLALILYLIAGRYPDLMGIVIVLTVSILVYPLLLFVSKTITPDDRRIIREILKTLPAPYEKIINDMFNRTTARQDSP